MHFYGINRISNIVLIEGEKMREVMEEYGRALLAIIEVIGTMEIVYSCITNEGMVYQIAKFFMHSIGG